MPSRSLVLWQTHRQRQLDEVERAHAALAGAARGRHYATEQVNRAYVVLLASQFQGFAAISTRKPRTSLRTLRRLR